ncbi:type II toxin-antitoxin system RelE/ParE family toxin [Solitalea lacus]|uniref:type II toxin-antitoxin system RelE/ParE family toxin n=1 Tax=Solitalea lacus TaxID=2911172 RepID=UPI001EDAC013|nr:type II toxin-antitoxin system RelE/ParE family toxin [Solitalea lacus]UKJ09125.1 type II toxin-antitoxin system RelE/ParE family toxin [Solitalea lacus]
MVKVNWTLQSIHDIEHIADFIALDSERYAEIQVQRFFDAVEILETQPKAGRIVPEFNNQAVREIIQGNYRIIYRIVSADLIDVLTVHHSRRLLSNNPALGREE